MNIINVDASKSYCVVVEPGLLSRLGTELKKVSSGCKVAIITDSNVANYYLPHVQKQLADAGYRVYSHVFPAGEASKNANTLFQILNDLAQQHFTRSDLLIALGGGVVGDITGFAASCYLRGVPYVQIPTTLLAMVDSSVGGKTAIDLPAGKNLVGAFYQPSLVLCDPATLATLPAEIFRDGCAEVIKYGILYDPALLGHLLQAGTEFDRQYVITRCIELKRDVVCEDEYDTGLRQKLNLGHTVGHAIELNSEYAISHGTAVAVGIAIIARAAQAAQMCDQKTADAIISALLTFGLPINCSYSASELVEGMLSDKKRLGSTVTLIIPHLIGHCSLMPIHVDQLERFIQAGL